MSLVGRVMRSRPWRANERLGTSRGAILAAGIAFYGVFSLFPLLVLGFAVAGVVVGGNARLQAELVGFVEEALPGIIGEGDSAVVSADDLLAQATDTTVLGISAAIGVGALLFTGLGWIAALREGIRAMFRLPTMQLDLVRTKLFDLAVMLTLGTLIVAAAISSVVAQTLTDILLGLVGLQDTTVGTVLGSAVVLLLAVLLNTALFTVLYRVLANTGTGYRVVLSGALVAAVGVAVLQLLVGVVLGNVGGSFGFLAAFVPVLTLFVWLNLNARVMLFGASWVAVGARPAVDAAALQTTQLVGHPEELTPERPARTSLPASLPVRWSDRAVLGAGVVLGASAFGLWQVGVGAVRTVGGGVRSLLDRED